MITRKALPRRTFLRGMGATVALPLLDAMRHTVQPRRRDPHGADGAIRIGRARR